MCLLNHRKYLPRSTVIGKPMSGLPHKTLAQSMGANRRFHQNSPKIPQAKARLFVKAAETKTALEPNFAPAAANLSTYLVFARPAAKNCVKKTNFAPAVGKK
jgi:hypothetical protein